MMTAVVMRQPETRYCVQRLRGLDPKTYYQDEETGTVYSGAMLMNAGLNLTRDVYEDGTSVTKHFKAVK
jgi:alpha-galactosidase